MNAVGFDLYCQLLAQAIQESHSPSLQAIMRKDLDDLLAQHPLSSPDDDQKDQQA